MPKWDTNPRSQCWRGEVSSCLRPRGHCDRYNISWITIVIGLIDSWLLLIWLLLLSKFATYGRIPWKAVTEPTPIHSIAYIHHPATPTTLSDIFELYFSEIWPWHSDSTIGIKIFFYSNCRIHVNSPKTQFCNDFWSISVSTRLPISEGLSKSIKHKFLPPTNSATRHVIFFTSNLGQVQGFRLTQHWFEYFIQ
jgi:hypothetical protein